MSNIKKLVTPEGVFETEMTPEEINAREQKLIEEQQLAEQARIDNEAKKAQKDADALAGNNKLLELGLTQAQVTAMTGYTPPAN
jgi:hypothetical protein